MTFWIMLTQRLDQVIDVYCWSKIFHLELKMPNLSIERPFENQFWLDQDLWRFHRHGDWKSCFSAWKALLKPGFSSQLLMACQLSASQSKVGNLLSPSLLIMKRLILVLWVLLFFFHQKLFIFCSLENFLWDLICIMQWDKSMCWYSLKWFLLISEFHGIVNC